MKNIALAIHNYDGTYQHLPANTRDGDGTPLLSWRVLILPFIEEESLYKEFRLDEAWDSPHNIQLLSRMPRVYQSVGVQPPAPHMTFYRGFTGPGTAFEREGLRLHGDFQKPLMSTILLIEAGDAIAWTKPEDLEYHADKALPPLGGVFRSVGWLDRQRSKPDGFNAAFVDGDVRFLPRDTDEKELREWIVRTRSKKR